MTKLLCVLIRLYQWQSPFWGAHCRFYPSCSAYMREVLQTFGFWKGLHLGAARLLKCHPWHPGGVDLVETCHPRYGRPGDCFVDGPRYITEQGADGGK